MPSIEATSSRVKLRLDHNLILPSSKSLMEMDFSDKTLLKKLFKDLLTIHVNSLNLELTMSTVMGLADLAEDEIIATPIPMEVNCYEMIWWSCVILFYFFLLRLLWIMCSCI